MRLIPLLWIIFTSTLLAVSLDDVIQRALASSPSLEMIRARLDANKHEVSLADQFADPEFSITTNTLPADQAMSQTVVSFKQNIPFYSKREKRQNISLAEQKLLNEELKKAQSDLVAQIKIVAYSIWQIQEMLKITDQYISITQDNITLYESYTSVDANRHMGIMKAELSLSELKIAQANLNAQLTQYHAKLSALCAHPVKNLHISLMMGEKPNLQTLRQTLTNNPSMAIEKQQILKQNAIVADANINNYPDINLIASYAYREKFDNYLNVGFSFHLPIYGTQDLIEQKQRALLLAKNAHKADISLQIEAKLQTYYATMQTAYTVYHIIQDEAFAKVAHMFDLSNTSISTGGDLFQYVDVLLQKLKLEKTKIDAIATYNKARAKIEQLQGKTS